MTSSSSKYNFDEDETWSHVLDKIFPKVYLSVKSNPEENVKLIWEVYRAIPSSLPISENKFKKFDSHQKYIIYKMETCQ